MTRGIEVEDVVVGTGDRALRGMVVIARVHMFLNHGTEVAALCGPRMMIDLGRRECIAGLRHGIEGMRVGGVRRLAIAPHLAYGAKGIPDRVPPNALLRCEVELLEVREPGVVKPGDFPGGTSLLVFHPGEAARNLARWQFHLDENGRCGVALDFPIPGMTWRHTRRKAASVQTDPAAASTLFESAINLPDQFPAECLRTEQLWADKAEPANSITRDQRSNSLCLTISVWEPWQQRMYYSVSETSPALLGSELYRVISSLLEPYLAAEAGEQSTQPRERHLPE